jgi:hypothetical protein
VSEGCRHEVQGLDQPGWVGFESVDIIVNNQNVRFSVNTSVDSFDQNGDDGFRALVEDASAITEQEAA